MLDVMPLGSVTKWLSGGTPSRSRPSFWSGDIPWISAATMKSFDVTDSDQRVSAEAVRSGSTMAPLGSTLLLVRGSALHNEIRACHVAGPLCFNQDVKALVPDDRVEPRFLTHSIRANEARLLATVSSATNSAGVLDTRQTQSLPVWIPSKEVQRTIVQRLDDADRLITALERMIAKKQAIKQGMMQQLLTGRTRLPGFTVPWQDMTLGEVAHFSKGMGLPKSSLAAGGRHPCVHYGELFTHYGPEIRSVSSRTNDTSLRVRSVINDVLMPTSDVTPRGLAKASALMADGVVLGGDILVIRSDRHRLFGPFLAHAIRLDANQVLQLVRGSTVYHLYAADMRTFQLKLPPVDEQRAICDALRDVEDEIELLDGRLVKARAIKTGMMQQLLTGRTRLPVEDAA